MSEKIFALLLRLYPARFRDRYGEESLHLLRDRLRDETGLFARLRLTFDLFTDTALALPRTHRMLAPAVSPVAATTLHRTPSFSVLEPQSLRPAILVLAWILALTGTGGFTFLLNYAGTRTPNAHASSTQPESRVPEHTSTARNSFPVVGKHGDAASGAASQASATPAASVPQQPQTQNSAASPAVPAIFETPPLTPEDRRRIVEAVALNLRQHYVDPAVAQRASDSILTWEKNGADNAAARGNELAVLLTQQIRDVTHDLHLEVVYSAQPLPPAPTAPSPADLARYRQAMLQQNCTIEKVATLPHNIGYLKIDSFPNPDICQTPITSAMASLNHSDAVIFDIRDNHGGEPDMVALVAARLFDRPRPWYNPRQAQPEFTHSPVPGSLLADKPVYILTSASTWSGAEQFSYNLKMLHRATLVGETTRGGAHAGVFHRIDDHFGMGIPEIRIVNPYGGADWEGAGVTPDVKVKAADALMTAERLARDKLAANAPRRH